MSAAPAAGYSWPPAPQTLAHDYGIAQVSVDGIRPGAPVDGYAPNVEITDAPQDYGQISLPAGSNTITITLTGKAPGRPATTPARLAAGYTGNWPCKWIATCAKSGAAQS